MGKAANLEALRRLAADCRRGRAVEAVRAGLDVLEAGLRRRCPVGRTRELVDSIRRTRIGVGPHAAGGSVIVTSRHALPVEAGTQFMAARPFVRPTREIDGPKAIRAMAAVLLRGG